MKQSKISLEPFQLNALLLSEPCMDLSEVASILNSNPAEPRHITTLCSEACHSSTTNYLRMCYSSTTGLAGLFDGGNCLFNEDREMCFAAISNSFLSPSSNIQWPRRVTAECFTNFTMFVDTTPTENCTNGCRRGLQQARDELGCCMDAIYNNSFVCERVSTICIVVQLWHRDPWSLVLLQHCPWKSTYSLLSLS